MVSQSVPKNYTFSPAEGTPHLTINHDVAAELDSSNAFEGTFVTGLVRVIDDAKFLLQDPRSYSRFGSPPMPTPFLLAPSLTASRPFLLIHG